MLGKSAEPAIPVCACACTTRAAAARRSRFCSFAVVSSGGSSGAFNVVHQSICGQTGASFAMGAVNAGGTSPSFNGTGAGVVQAANANTATEVEGSNNFMESLFITGRRARLHNACLSERKAVNTARRSAATIKISERDMGRAAEQVGFDLGAS